MPPVMEGELALCRHDGFVVFGCIGGDNGSGNQMGAAVDCPWSEVEEGCMEYLFQLPKPGQVPAGKVVVHNNVRPTRNFGSRGFRAWLESEPQQNLLPCPCDWAPELGTHYRIDLAVDKPA